MLLLRKKLYGVTMSNLSVFGLGKLGATMVGCFAASGHHVIGVDVVDGNVESVSRGESPVFEPGLQDLYYGCSERISATRDVSLAVQDTDVSFIIVPTPSMQNGEFFTTIAKNVAENIGEVLAEKEAYHLIVLTSTVLPGATERDIKTALESKSGKKCGEDFGLCYSPEFIAIGDVINGLMRPDYFLIGEYDEKSGNILESIYDRMRRAKLQVSGFIPQPSDDLPQIIRMNIVNAELTKIAVNTAVTAKISFANTLCRICSKLPGGDARVVANAVGSDKRIGTKYLKPGATFGGPCFPRDNRAFAWVARSLQEEAPSAEATDAINQHQIDFLVRYILSTNPCARTIGLLGLSYKPRTNIMEESLGTELAKRFLGRALLVRAYDPWVHKQGTTETVDGLRLADSIEDCIEASDTIVICTAHEEYASLKPSDFERENACIPVVDVWSLLRDNGFEDLYSYHVPGVNRGIG